MLTVIVSFFVGVAVTLILGAFILAVRDENYRREREQKTTYKPWDSRKTSIFDGRPLNRRP